MNQQLIPLCRAEFLQDFTIALGRCLKPIRYASKSVRMELDTIQHEGQSMERLSVWVETWSYTRVSLTLWEDRTVWVSVELLPTKNNKKYQIDFYPKCNGFTETGIVEALRGTVSVSTRLCYGECPLEIVRRIWKHDDAVETTGKLASARRTLSK